MNINNGKIHGLDELNHILRHIPDKAKGEVTRTLKEDLSHLQGEASELAPYEWGALEGSGDSGATANFKGVEGFVSFDEPYATIQHENMDFQHAPGKTAKYLEKPLKEMLPEILSDIKKAIIRGCK